GNARHAHSAHAEVGASTRSRYRAGDSERFGRSVEDRAWFALSGASSIGSATAHQGRVEDVRPESPSQVLRTHQRRSEASCRRTVEVEVARPDNRPRDEAGIRGRCMAWWNFWRSSREQDLDDELSHDFAAAVDQRIRAGLAPDEAECAARREFGSVTAI